MEINLKIEIYLILISIHFVLEKRKYNLIYQICEIDDCKIFFESKNINNIFFAHYLES